jgi:hypothetical protein
MKWIAISGSWRRLKPEVEVDVRRTVREIFERGDGVITGGALGADYIATDEMLSLDGSLTHLKIFIPTPLYWYSKHYLKRASEGVITFKQANALARQLSLVQQINPQALIENLNNKDVNEATYFERDTAVVNSADELVAFQVNFSAGTQDTINKARQKGIPVQIFAYTL